MARAPSVLAILATGCVATAQPRFPDDIALAVAAHPMRRLDTDRLILYYPQGRGEVARRAAARITTCLERARARAVLDNDATDERPRIVMPELEYNNAFVAPRLSGYETISVVPTGNTLDFATEFGLPPDPGWIGCHEVTHYVHEQQMGAGWARMHAWFGESLSPQLGLDAWFWEGLATYYEDAGGRAVGRLAWPVWRGMFAAAYAGVGLDGDDLSEWKRDAPPGHHYLVGSHFIEWLVATYGEDRLWELIARQGRAFVFVLSINSRFSAVYGKSLSRLIGEFDGFLKTLPRRAVPAGERRLRAVGDDARYARAPDGTEAIVADDVDRPTRLEIRGPDGGVRVEANLVDLVVPRKLVVASPILVSGMSFTADGKALYLTAVDLGDHAQTTRLVRVDVASGDLDVVASGLGPGGAISPDGARYYHGIVDGDAWGLGAYELASGDDREVMAPHAGDYVLRVAPSPSGDRLALSEWDGSAFVIAIGEQVLAGAPGRPAYDATWIDDHRIAYLEAIDGRFQIVAHDLDSGDRVVLTDAPYTAFEPRAAGGTVRFLDRDGWQWHLAEVADAGGSPPAPIADPEPAREPVVAAVAISSDQPYSKLDGLFRPQLHTLAFASPEAGASLLGVGLAGGDHLGFQRWALTLYGNPGPEPRWSVSGGYATSALAPWRLSFAFEDLRWNHPIDDDPDVAGPERYADRSTRDLSAHLGMTVRGTTDLSFEAIYARDRFTDEPTWKRLGGLGVHLVHDNVEATLHGGVRRRLALAGDATWYPAVFSTIPADLLDTRAVIALTAPVPRTRRHALDLELRHRLVDVRDPVPGLTPLEVGGAGPYASIWEQAAPDRRPPALVEDAFLPRLRFVEPLRGFEDWPMPASGAAIAEATWRYPIPIDRGWATSFRIMPPILFRDVELELFGVAAAVAPPAYTGRAIHHHLAGGAALGLSMILWRLPLVIRYQLARRATDDQALTQQVGIGFAL